MSYPHVQQRECHCVIYLTVAGMRPLIKPSNAFEGNTVHLLLCPQTGQKQTTEKKNIFCMLLHYKKLAVVFY